MPRFFFSLHSSSHVEVDDVGSEFPDPESAIAAAKDLLPSLARETQWDDAYELAVAVRDEAGEVVFTASLRLSAMRPVLRCGLPPAARPDTNTASA